MKVKMNTSQFNVFAEKVDILKDKGYELPFTVDRNTDGIFEVELLGEHNLEELDNLTET